MCYDDRLFDTNFPHRIDKFDQFANVSPVQKDGWLIENERREGSSSIDPFGE